MQYRERLNDLNKSIAKRKIAGKWLLLHLKDAKQPGCFYSKLITPLSFDQSKVKIKCNDLWFSTEWEEIQVWFPRSKKTTRYENLSDLLTEIEAYPLIRPEINKILSLLADAKAINIDYRNFMEGLLSNNSGIDILTRYFSISCHDVYKNITSVCKNEFKIPKITGAAIFGKFKKPDNKDFI
ncbi:MAG: hypothetical protein N3G74_00295 [Candidatus Micrarchaeota archaeon]|nr:hypothetical protein [Candidatus Micrarchaeota archaeon]